MHIRIMPNGQHLISTEQTTAVENIVKMRPLCCTSPSFVFSKDIMTTERLLGLRQLGHFDIFYGYSAATNERISGYD